MRIIYSTILGSCNFKYTIKMDISFFFFFRQLLVHIIKQLKKNGKYRDNANFKEDRIGFKYQLGLFCLWGASILLCQINSLSQAPPIRILVGCGHGP